MSATSPTLPVGRRVPEGSRSTRRLRRSGHVPCVIYGGGEPSLPLQVEFFTLQRMLAQGSQIVDLSVDGDGGLPVLLKDVQRHPVTNAPLHVDFLRVRLDEAIQTTVLVELEGADDAPGVKEGGVLEQVTRELTVEALPGDIPEVLTHDVSGLEAAATLHLSDLVAPAKVTFVDDPEMVIATVTVPKAEVAADAELEQETERVGDPDVAAEELGEDAPDDPGVAPG